MDNWNKIFKPIVVLGCICVVVTAALALTNEATAPRIAELAEQAAAQAREELMPGMAFELVPCEVDNVTTAFVSAEGAAILTATAKGYGGTMVVMVAFDPQGSIVKVIVQSDGETPGIGDKATKGEGHLAQYMEKDASQLTLGIEIEAVSGATISSNAVNDAVNSAIAGYAAVS